MSIEVFKFGGEINDGAGDDDILCTDRGRTGASSQLS